MNKYNKNIVAVVFTPLFLLLVVYPLVALLAHLEFTGIVKTFADPYFWLSVRNTICAALLAAFLSLVLAVGFGYCYLFLRGALIYKVANLMNDLPIALPHTVAGLTLLLAFGRKNFGFIRLMSTLDGASDTV